jgi:hypothetical protein
MKLATRTLPAEQDSAEDAPVIAREAFLSTAERAECNCPEWCERDHDRD